MLPTMPPRCTKKPGGSLVMVRRGNSGMPSPPPALVIFLLGTFSEPELPALAPREGEVLVKREKGEGRR